MTENTTSLLRSDVKVEVTYNRFRQAIHTLIYEKKYIQEEGEEPVQDTTTIPPGQFEYGGIVNVLVTKEYPADKMQAVQNNFLLDPVAYKKEFDLMQAWRAEAKEIAKAALESQNPNHDAE